jgi:preprotein translocase subunit SecY
MGTIVNPVQLILFIILFLACTWFVVMFTQAQRRIPVQHMRRNFGTQSKGGGTSYLPISVNMAGVIPIIFAIALVNMPNQLASALPTDSQFHVKLLELQKYMYPNFREWQGYVAALVYMVLIFGFTFMWNAMVYNVEDISNNLKRAGSYVPGIRPGKQTKDFLNGVITRVTFLGALFLSFAALVQYVYPLLINIPQIMYVGGTSLLIMVSVALETMRQIEANLLVKQYGN